MKAYIPLFILVEVCVLSCFAQEPPQPSPEFEQMEMSSGFDVDETIPPRAGFQAKMEMELQKAREQVAAAQEKLHSSGHQFVKPFMQSFGTGFGFNPDTENTVLLVPAKSISRQIVDQRSEDLQVMTLILNKAINPVTIAGTIDRHNYGFHLKLPGLSSDQLPLSRAIWLDGYGAMITMAVDFPLTEVEEEEIWDKDDMPEEAKTDDGVWQRNKKILIGMEEPGDDPEMDALAFDPDKVQQLEKKVIEAMKHASHIRNMASDDKLVIVIRSYIEGEFLNRPSGEDVEEDPIDPVMVPQSVMTLQARRKDIEAFSEEKIDFEAFKKKVSVIIY